MNNSELIKAGALKIVTEAHYGQKRKDGKDYVTHVIAVAKINEEKFTEENGFDEESRLLACLLGLGHDLEEDTQTSAEHYIARLVVDYGLNEKLGNSILESIRLLNRKQYKNYFEYIMEVAQDFWARETKMSDLEHNMSDLEEGSLKDKYRLAFWILNNYHRISW